jgi:hypothetical protein
MNERQLLAGLGSIGGLWLVAGLALIATFEDFRPLVVLVFIVVSGIVPTLAAGVVHLADRSGMIPRPAFDAALLVVKAFLLCLLGTMISLFLSQSITHAPADISRVAAVFFLMIAAAIVAVRFILPSRSSAAVSDALDGCLIGAIAVAVFLFSPFNPADPEPVGFIKYAVGARHFLLWLAVGVLWTAVGIWLRRHQGWMFPRKLPLLRGLTVALVGLAIAGLYDDGHFVDFGHYAPLVGPALHAMRGGVPMVDTYSQYGFLPWFVLRVAFGVFEPTFGTAAVVVRGVNLAYLAVIAALALSVSRRSLSALWFLVPAMLLAITTHNPGPTGMWNMNSLPMTLGGRWLLPASMTLLLVSTRQQRSSSRTALVLLMLASLAGVDTLALTFAPWGYCRLLDAIRLRSARFFLREMMLAGGAVAVAQLALATVIYAATGELVDYRPYLDLILQFRPSEESHWSVPFVPYYALWSPIAFTYFLIMSAATHRALRGEFGDSVVERLLPVAVFGLGPLAYFFGRPQEGTLNIACLSFAVVAIGVAEVVFLKPQRFGSAGRVLYVVVFLAFSFAVADAFEHFMRPMKPSLGNATILRRCFTDRGCELARVPERISLALHTQPLDPRTEVGYLVGGPRDGRARIEEATAMVRKLAPHAHTVGLLTDYTPSRYADSDAAIALTVFMATGQWFPWQISTPFNDGRGPLITDRILRRIAATPSGLLVIVPNRRDGWAPINRSIWQILGTHCRLSLIEKSKYHSAFLTKECR